MKDAVATMGGLLPDDASGRDAVHVAVFSAHSGVKVYPGQDVAIVTQSEPDSEVSPVGGMLIGIVDPFLRTPAMPGERFWVYLYPRTITSLAHRWGHPAFGEASQSYAPPSSKIESELWLAKFCADYDNKEYNFKLREVLEKVFDGKHYDEYITLLGSDEKGDIPPELWRHCAIVFGKPIPSDHPTFFSCSC